MNLGFSQYHKSGTPTFFRERILLPYKPELRDEYPVFLPKIHTFRLGTRWKEGMLLHMLYNARNKNREQFNLGVKELERCTGVQDCIIWATKSGKFEVHVDDRMLKLSWLHAFMFNDGFDTPELFADWFKPKTNTIEYVGQIIHWTDYRY